MSGATAEALTSYESAIDDLVSWREGADSKVAAALLQSPRFTMAHVLQAYVSVCSRDHARVRSAARLLQRFASLVVDEREHAHLMTVRSMIAGDYAAAKNVLGELLHAHPRDLLALHVAHLIDHWMGDVVGMQARTAAVLPAWRATMPGHHAVLAMHAFGLVECGEAERGEEHARAALEIDATNARAHHAMAHAFETTDRAAQGLRWMHENESLWAHGTAVATHGWWHVALFELAQDQVAGALHAYDERVRADRSRGIGDLIDAASLLWRIELKGASAGSRWSELAQAWAPHIRDRHCSFSDVHAMLAFVGAREWSLAEQLEAALDSASQSRTRHGETTRELGLRACRGLLAYGRENLAMSIALLAKLPARVHRLGGSHAQRDVLHLTLMRAVERMRRPARMDRSALAA